MIKLQIQLRIIGGNIDSYPNEELAYSAPGNFLFLLDREREYFKKRDFGLVRITYNEQVFYISFCTLNLVIGGYASGGNYWIIREGVYFSEEGQNNVVYSSKKIGEDEVRLYCYIHNSEENDQIYLSRGSSFEEYPVENMLSEATFPMKLLIRELYLTYCRYYQFKMKVLFLSETLNIIEKWQEPYLMILDYFRKHYNKEIGLDLPDVRNVDFQFHEKKKR